MAEAGKLGKQSRFLADLPVFSLILEATRYTSMASSV